MIIKERIQYNCIFSNYDKKNEEERNQKNIIIMKKKT